MIMKFVTMKVTIIKKRLQMIKIGIDLYVHQFIKCNLKKKCRTSSLSRYKWVMEVLHDYHIIHSSSRCTNERTSKICNKEMSWIEDCPAFLQETYLLMQIFLNERNICFKKKKKIKNAKITLNFFKCLYHKKKFFFMLNGNMLL